MCVMVCWVNTTTRRTCVFCGADAGSQEHVLATWIGKAFAITTSQHHWHVAEGDAARVRRFHQRPFQMTVGCVCRSCNHGWMSRLEGEVKRLLRPMMLSPSDDLPFTLTRDDQRVLALWAAKTLMVLQGTMTERERAVPPEHYAELFEHQRAPHRCRIAVARRPMESASWPYRILQVAGDWRTTPPPGPRPDQATWNTYRAFMAVGHAVFHLLGFHDNERDGHLRPGDLPAAFIEIWPAGPTRLWRADPPVTIAGLEPLVHIGQARVARRRAS
jgi:hypothetical protein